MSPASMQDLDRIVLVDPSDFTTPYDLALAGAIQSQGRQVSVVGQAGALSHPPSLHHGHFYPLLNSSIGRRLPGRGVRLVKGACHGFDMLRLIRWVTTFGAGIAHFQWSPIPMIDRWVIRSLRHRVPVVMTLHDSNPYQGEANWLMRHGYLNLLHSVDAIIVHTQQAQHRVAAMGIDRAVIYRIPHGLLGEAKHSRKPAARRPSSRDRLVLLQFGKIKPYKGVDLLLEALTLIPQELRRRLDVRIVGKPYMDTAGIEEFVHANGLAGCVSLRFEFVSETEEEQLFAEADAILLPYRDIDASGVAMSAIGRGLPVLATAIDGFRELFEEGGGARLVRAADAASLSTAIFDWISAPEQLDALAKAMWLRRASIPAWAEIASLHLGVYAEAHARWLTRHERENGSSVAVRQEL
jgi:glycosyltransferase involved in cell wall biosynthesis